MDINIEAKEIYLIGGSFLFASFLTSNINFLLGCSALVLPSLIKAVRVENDKNKERREHEKISGNEKGGNKQ